MAVTNNIIPVQRRFLTRKEAAEYLGVCMHAMQILCFNRKIRYYRPNGKQSYFDVADLDAYIMGGEVIEPSDKEKIVRGGRVNSKKQKS